MGNCLDHPLTETDERQVAFQLKLAEILIQTLNKGSLIETTKMSDFKLHHHVNELLTLLKGNDGKVSIEGGAEGYVDLLLKSINPQVTSQAGSHGVVKKLAEFSHSPDDFVHKYEELKSKNVRDLDQFVYLLSKIAADPKTRTFLSRNADHLSGSSSTTSSTVSSIRSPKLTTDGLAMLQSRIKEGTSTVPNWSFQKTKTGSIRSEPKNVAEFPSWVRERPNLTLDYNVVSTDDLDPGALMGALPLPSQEHALLEDMLYVLGGIPGDHIVPLPITESNALRSFNLDETIDTSFKELIRRILPVCSDYSIVTRFIEDKSSFDSGQVNHSLCAAMRSIIKDYLILVAQLEHQHRQGLLTLQRLWFYLQPTMRSMEILASIATLVSSSNAKGGVVLSCLHERTCTVTGDPKSQEICLYLIQAACVPYFEILEKWIYKGIICDPFGEFLVEDNELVQKEELPVDYSDDYWEKRYTICRERIPVFLEKVSDMILRTGKYLNVIRQCGSDIKCPDAESIIYTLKERQYVEKIEKSYGFASRKLLDLLMEEKDLMGRLKSVKHYFLLDQGDFVVQFLDMAEEELKKNIDDIMPTRLESLLELALRTSIANNDPYKDDIRVVLLPFDLLFQMNKILSIDTKEEEEYRYPMECKLSGLEAFTFDYDVKWPLSLVLNRKAIACYQMLFRHLLYSKHVERLLCNVWLCNKLAKPFPLSASWSYAPAFALRQRMLNFVQNLEYYMMFEVLEPNWHVFVTKLNSVSNVDDVLSCHTDFINTCLKDCMLTSPELLKIVNKLMLTFVKFSNFILHVNKYFVDAEMSSMLESVPNLDSPDLREDVDDPHSLKAGDSFEENIATFDMEFNKYLIILLDRISDLGRENYNEKLVNILYRVDFNSFYTERLEKYTSERSIVESTTTSSSSSSKPKMKRPPVPPKSPKLTSQRIKS